MTTKAKTTRALVVIVCRGLLARAPTYQSQQLTPEILVAVSRKTERIRTHSAPSKRPQARLSDLSSLS